MKTFNCVFISFVFLLINLYSQTNSWIYKSNMPTARTFLSHTILDNKLYVIGGCPTTNATNKVEVYDPSSDSWSSVSNLPTALCYSMSCTYQNKIYVFGGAPGMWSNAGKSVYVFDSQTGIWTQKSDMPFEIGGGGIAIVGDTIYIIGGGPKASSPPNNKLIAYHPDIDNWSLKANLPTARNLLSACVFDGKIYAIGGTTDDWENLFYKVVEMYDPTTNTWTRKSDMPSGRYSSIVCVVDGLIYVIGGRAGTLSSTKNEAYDPIADSWRIKTSMQQSRTGLVGGNIENRIYVAGGHQGPPILFLSSCEEYFPDISEVKIESDFFTNKIKLHQNFPNPFNPSTKISWQSPVSGQQTIKLFDVLGREIETIVDGYFDAGLHSTLYIVHSTLPSGVYFYQLKAVDPSTSSGKSFIQTKKMILIK